MARPGYREIEKCRLCGNTNLQPIVSLGEQHLTGVFPRGLHAATSKGPLELVICTPGQGQESCGLVQLCQSYNPEEMYGAHYGYRSSSDPAMIRHLKSKAHHLIERFPLHTNDLILDIGSNDGTLLSFYPQQNVTVVGMDPTGAKFASYHQPHIHLIPDFFSAELFRKNFGEQKARIITSIAMFESLEDPLRFMREVASILDDEGVWHLEMRYLPSLVRGLSYDAIGHEHLEYYALRQIKWMTDRSDLKILDVEFNETNGGSFAITLAHFAASHVEAVARVEEVLQMEETIGLTTPEQQREFEAGIERHRTELLWFLHALKSEGHSVLGYGASAEGNVLLQHCGITRELVPAIAELNEDQLGCFTPGTHIPIISESEAAAQRPEYFLVMSSRTRDEILERETAFLARGGKFIFPLPQVEIVGQSFQPAKMETADFS